MMQVVYFSLLLLLKHIDKQIIMCGNLQNFRVTSYTKSTKVTICISSNYTEVEPDLRKNALKLV